MEAYYSLVGMTNDLDRYFELLEVLLPSFFAGASSIFKNEHRNKNSHAPIKSSTMKAMLKIPAIQAEFEFYHFVQQRFEQLYSKYKNFQIK